MTGKQLYSRYLSLIERPAQEQLKADGKFPYTWADAGMLLYVPVKR